MKGNPIGWFEIYVQDMARAKKFYEGVFKVTLNSLNSPDGALDMQSFPSEMNTYGTGGALVKMESVPSGGNSTLVYFMCDDCKDEEGLVASSGGKIMREKFAIGEYGFCSLVFDTEGNLFGLHSMK